MRMNAVVRAALGLAFGAAALSAQAATLSGNVSADDFLKVYLSTDLTVTDDELVLNKTSSWQSAESFSTALTAGQSVYLLVEARDAFGAPSMFIGSFAIDSNLFQFSNGTQQLITDTTEWRVGASGFASATATPFSIGALPALPTWGNFPSIGSNAQALWMDTGSGQADYSVKTTYFVTRITAAVPEPTSYAMFGAGLAVLGAIARRRRG